MWSFWFTFLHQNLWKYFGNFLHLIWLFILVVVLMLLCVVKWHLSLIYLVNNHTNEMLLSIHCNRILNGCLWPQCHRKKEYLHCGHLWNMHVWNFLHHDGVNCHKFEKVLATLLQQFEHRSGVRQQWRWLFFVVQLELHAWNLRILRSVYSSI